MSSNVFRQKALAPDVKVGRVEPDGRVYAERFGPDHYIGRVEVDTGRVWEAHLGPDKLIGHVEPGTGRCFRARFGPDEYVGRAAGDGRLYRHVPVAIDEYIGSIEHMAGLAHAGAALLLLVLPEVEAEQQTDDEQASENPGEDGAPS